MTFLTLIQHFDRTIFILWICAFIQKWKHILEFISTGASKYNQYIIFKVQYESYLVPRKYCDKVLCHCFQDCIQLIICFNSHFTLIMRLTALSRLNNILWILLWRYFANIHASVSTEKIKHGESKSWELLQQNCREVTTSKKILSR